MRSLLHLVTLAALLMLAVHQCVAFQFHTNTRSSSLGEYMYVYVYMCTWWSICFYTELICICPVREIHQGRPLVVRHPPRTVHFTHSYIQLVSTSTSSFIIRHPFIHFCMCHSWKSKDQQIVGYTGPPSSFGTAHTRRSQSIWCFSSSWWWV